MQTITAQQSRDARRELGLSQADVTKALDLNRQYLSEFETGFSTRLTAAQLKKLRAFYESKIEEANASGESISLTFGEPSPNDPKSSLNPDDIKTTMLAVRHLSVDHNLSNEQIADILARISDNDKEASEALSQKANHGAFSNWDDHTTESLRKVFGLFAANYVLMRHLQGRPMVVLEQPIDEKDIQSVSDLFAYHFYEANGDLITPVVPGSESIESEEVSS